MKKRIFSLILTLIMVATMLPTFTLTSSASDTSDYVASVIINGVTTPYTDFDLALSAAQSASGTVFISLLADVSGDYTVERGKFTIYLNSKKWSSDDVALTVSGTADVTIDDTSNEMNGSIDGVAVNGGKFTLANGTLGHPKRYALAATGGNTNITGGSVTDTFIILGDSGSVTISGGLFTANILGVSYSTNYITLSITGGSFKYFNPTNYVDGAHIVTKDTSTEMWNVARDPSIIASVTVNGTTEFYPTLSSAMDAAQAANSKATVKLLGDTIDSVIISRGNITLDLCGNELKASHYAIGIMGGDLTITDSASGGTIFATNYAILMQGGTLSIEGGHIVGQYYSGMHITTGSCTISAGVFQGGIKSISGEKGTLSVTGGTFNTPPVEYVADGYAVKQKPGFDTYDVVKALSIELPVTLEGGNVTADNPNPIEGDSVTITVTPDADKKVDTVTVTDKDGNPIPVTDNGNGTYTFTMPANEVSVNVTYGDIRSESEALANIYFVLLALLSRRFEIDATVTEGGAISSEGISSVRYSKSISYTITPDEGYELISVIVDGEDIGVTSEYTFENVKADHTIHAVFAPVNPDSDVTEND